MEQLFYVQNGVCGNSMMWWKHDNCGYVCDIQKAKQFTQAEIDKMDSIKEGSKTAWPVEYIDERIQHHIDFQYCTHEDAMAGIQDVEQTQ